MGWRLLSRMRSGSTVVSRQREYDLTSQIAELTSDETIGEAFAGIFREGAWSTVVVGGAGDTPSEAEVVGVLDRCQATAGGVATRAEEVVPTIDLDVESEGVIRSVRSIEFDPATGMTTTAFDNGVIVHHKKVEGAASRVVIGVALAGGRSEEDAATRGYTNAAASIWENPAWCGTSAAAVDTALAGRDIEFEGSVLDDAMQVTVSCDTQEVGAALRVVASTIGEPVIEAGGLRRWKDSVAADAARRRGAPGRMIGDVLDGVVRGDDPRFGVLDGADAARVELGAAQRWAEEFMDRAPIEATIVGDIERHDALEAAAATLGALPARERIGKAPRVACVVEGAITVHATCDSSADHAMVMVGYRGVRYAEREAFYELMVVKNLWQERASLALQEKEQVASWVGTGVAPGVSDDSVGMVWAAAAVQEDQVGPVAERLLTELGVMLRDGVREEELEGARQQALLDAQSRLDDPMHIALISLDMRYRGVDMAQELRGPQTIRSVDAWRVREVLEGIVDREKRVVVTILPEKSDTAR